MRERRNLGRRSARVASAALLPGRVLCVAVLSGAAPIDAEGLDFTDGLTATNVAATTEQGDTTERPSWRRWNLNDSVSSPIRGPRWILRSGDA